MIENLYVSYQYYYFRLYLFYLKQWNNNKELAKFATTFILLISNVSNIALLAILSIGLFNIKERSSLGISTSSGLNSTALTIIIIVVIILIIMNYTLLFSKHQEIIEKFNNEKDKVNYSRNGWFVLVYALAPFLAFFLLAYFL